ncbi:MAG: hypothetical protein HW388_766 [Dehalococcoidia bacterium]|nr:hypothetical protein [Dehalococcoidia bacterium]
MAAVGIPRRALLLAVLLVLVVGVLAGLGRVGWDIPISWQVVGNHGPLMVSGFLGTLIGLERAVGIRRRPAYAVPGLSLAGTLLLLAGATAEVASVLTSLSALGLAAIYFFLARPSTAYFLGVMALGAFMWLGGNVLWGMGRPFAEVAPWWSAFLVLTIAGERLELGRVRRLSAAVLAAFFAAVSILVVGVATTALAFDPGVRVFGAGLLALALWLLRHDLAWRTARIPGLPRYMGVALLLGYAWLAVGGVVALGSGGVYGGPEYDVLLHAVFLGFVMSMVFAHAPVMLPAVAGVTISFTRAFYVPLVLLHGSLALRVVGDLVGSFPSARWGSLFNGAALALFFLVVAGSALIRRRSRR